MSKFGRIADDIADLRNKIMHQVEDIEPEIALVRAIRGSLDDLWNYLHGQGFGNWEIAKGFAEEISYRTALNKNDVELFEIMANYQKEAFHVWKKRFDKAEDA